MQITLASRGRFAACLLLAGTVACTEGDPSSSAENSPPVVASATFHVAEDGTVSGELDATDPDGDELALTLVTSPRSGAAILDGRRFSYRPRANFHGEDQLTFTASDGELTSEAARVTFRVSAVDDAPELAVNLFSGPAGFRITGQLAAEDLDGDSLTFAMPSPISGTLLEFDSATGRFIFEPSPHLLGDEVVPIAVVGNGVAVTGKATFRLEPVSFAGAWRASSVKLDDQPCASFELPIQTDAPGEVRFLAHEVVCGAATVGYDAMQLPLQGSSASSLKAAKTVPLGDGEYLDVAVAIEPVPATPGTYRYTETFSGAFDQVMTATLTRG